MNKPNLYSLHIGVENASERIYQESNSYPQGNIAAKDFFEYAKSQHFNSTLLIEENATRASVINALAELKNKLIAGDFLFVSFAGHGKVKETPESSESVTEYFGLYDFILIDDDFTKFFRELDEGIFVFVVLDCCKAAGLIDQEKILSRFNYPPQPQLLSINKINQIIENAESIERGPCKSYMLDNHWKKSLTENGKDLINSEKEKTKCSVILFAGTPEEEDNDHSCGIPRFSKFILKEWKNIKTNDTYNTLFEKVKEEMEKPVISGLRPHVVKAVFQTRGKLDQKFVNSTPFKI